ncbi:MAG: tetratricopeptide repeat protein [Acidobacteria bacterium]|nr:tetratricopeptide repeat protein [Acidobacteriota bacterium]
MVLSAIWLLGLPGDWLLDDFSLLDGSFPSLLRPLTYLTFWLNFETTGPIPWAYRLTNILLHAIAVQYCYRALKRIVGDQRALLAAALFAVHPLQSDAVLYVFSRPTVLMGLFLWVALDCWLAGKHKWSILSFTLALASKEEAIAFPLVLVLLHLSISRNSREWRPIGIMFALATATGAFAVFATRAIGGSGAGSQSGVSALDYLATQPAVISWYLAQLLIPQFPGMRWQVDLWPQWGILFWLLPLALAIIARQYFTRAQSLFWLLAGLAVLLPSSSIFPIADLAASRRMYLAIPLFVLAVPITTPRWLPAIALLYAAISANWATILYRDPAQLWKTTMALQPANIEPILQYCKYISPAEALRALEQQAFPQSPAYHRELGRIYLELGKPVNALGAFGRALGLEPGIASNVHNRGVALKALGQHEAAEADFKRALEIDPNHAPARKALATPSK